MKAKSKSSPYERQAFVSFLDDPTNAMVKHKIYTDKNLGYVCIHGQTQKIVSQHTNLRKCEQQAKIAMVDELSKKVGKSLIGKHVVFKKPKYYGDDKKVSTLYAKIPLWCSGVVKDVGLNSRDYSSRRRFDRTVIIKIDDKNLNEILSKVTKDSEARVSFVSSPNGYYLSYSGDIYFGGRELAAKLSKMAKTREKFDESARKVDREIHALLLKTEEL